MFENRSWLIECRRRNKRHTHLLGGGQNGHVRILVRCAGGQHETIYISSVADGHVWQWCKNLVKRRALLLRTVGGRGVRPHGGAFKFRWTTVEFCRSYPDVQVDHGYLDVLRTLALRKAKKRVVVPPSFTSSSRQATSPSIPTPCHSRTQVYRHIPRPGIEGQPHIAVRPSFTATTRPGTEKEGWSVAESNTGPHSK